MFGFYPGLSPYDPYSSYFGYMDLCDSKETQEEREQRSFSGLICVAICYIGVPLAMAIGYGIYKLITKA